MPVPRMTLEYQFVYYLSTTSLLGRYGCAVSMPVKGGGPDCKSVSIPMEGASDSEPLGAVIEHIKHIYIVCAV